MNGLFVDLLHMQCRYIVWAPKVSDPTTVYCAVQQWCAQILLGSWVLNKKNVTIFQKDKFGLKTTIAGVATLTAHLVRPLHCSVDNMTTFPRTQTTQLS